MEPIFSMAKSIKEMEKFYRNYSLPWIAHMLMIFYYPTIVENTYWWKDSYRFLPHEGKVYSGSHKYPNDDFIKENLFSWIYDNPRLVKDYFFKKLEKERKSVPTGFSGSFDDAMRVIGTVADEIAVYLSSKECDYSLTMDDYFAILRAHNFGIGRVVRGKRKTR